MSDVRDGTSNTYLVGEKVVTREGYTSVVNHDMASALDGVHPSNTRYAYLPMLADAELDRYGSPSPLSSLLIFSDRAISFSQRERRRCDGFGTTA